MDIVKETLHETFAVKLTAMDSGKPIGRAYLYILKNELHKEPFGFLEDVFVEEAYRKHGVGSDLVKAVIAEAKAQGCYKLVGTSRHEREKVHEFYERLGFKKYGLEFRMDL